MKNWIWSSTSVIVILFLSVMTWHLYGSNKVSYNKILFLTERKNILETSNAKISEQKKSVEEKLVALIAENGEAMAMISEYSARLEAITSEYKANEEDLIAERKKLRSDIGAFDRELSGKNSEIRFLRKSLRKIDKKLKDAKISPPTNLTPIVITGSKNVSGKILEVNKAYSFVIINLGSDDGISTGDTLFVSRKKALLGKVVVEETNQKYSSAKILYKTLEDAVRKGDEITN